jgi:hypothetical protein
MKKKINTHFALFFFSFLLGGCGGLHDGVPRDRCMNTPHGTHYQRMIGEVASEHQKYAEELDRSDRMRREMDRTREKMPDFKWKTLPPDFREKQVKQ